MPGFPVHYQLPKLALTHVHWVGDAIQPSHPLLSPFPPTFNLSQHQCLFQWISSSHQVAKVLELQHQSFQWIFRTDFLYDWLVWSPCSPMDSQESSPMPQFKSINSLALSFLYSPALTSITWLLEKPCNAGISGLATKSCLTLGTPWTVTSQAPLSMRFSRQEYWSGLPFPSPGFFPTQGSNLGLLHCRQILYWLSYKGSTMALTRWTFADKVMSLLFNMLARLVIAFLPRSKCLLISGLQSPSAVILEPHKIKSLTVSIVSPSISHEVIGPDAMILVFWTLSFKPTFSLSSFTFIKKLFSFSSLSAIRVVSSVYLRLLIFLPAILIPACASSSPAFRMMYSAYMLNKQGDKIQPWRTPFPIWNQSVVPCPVLHTDLHTDFSGGRSGGLLFPSLEEFSIVCCDPHSPRLWCGQ